MMGWIGVMLGNNATNGIVNSFLSMLRDALGTFRSACKKF
jgi:hypothetical protein